MRFVHVTIVVSLYNSDSSSARHTVRVVLPIDAHLIIKYIYSRICSRGSHPHLILWKFPCNNFVETVLENGFHITLINRRRLSENSL